MNQSPEVLAWLETYENPMNDVVRRVRDIIVHADPRIEESLEEQGPTYSYRGSLASFFPESKKHASLMVPSGAQIPGHHPRLEGEGETGRVMKIASVADANAAKDDLQHLVRAWCDWRDAEEAETEAREAAPARRKAAKPAAKKARRPASKKARKPAAKKARRPTAKKARKPAAKKARKPAAKKARKPAAKKARKPAARKASRPAATKSGRARKKS